MAAAAGFDHGLVVKQGGSVLAFGPAFKPPLGTPPGLYLASVALRVPVAAVAAGVCAGF